MVRISLCLLIATAAAAQTELGNGVVTLESGVTIKNRTVVEPTMTHSAFLPLGFGFRGGDALRYVICDKTSGTCVGFRLQVSAADSAGDRLATFGPIGPEAADMVVPITGDLPFRQAPLPKYPAPQTVHDGDTFALDLMTSADGKARIVNYLHFDFGGKAADARDFTIDDGLAAFAFKPAGEVLVNGTKPPGNAVFIDGHNRATVWVYLPGRGRYVLSLVPHDGFVRAGVARGAHLTFQAERDRVEVRLGQPLAGTEQAWNLYVLHEHGYTPLPGQEQLTIVSADRLENLLPKH
jgi:hypothetical protein